jgi:DNA methylase
VAKTPEALIASRRQRQAVLDRFGLVPESILRRDAAAMATDVMATERSYRSTARAGGHTGKLAQVFDVSGQSCREGALSRFPQNVGRTLLLLYSDEGDTVVDPFAGHNSRMELCWRNGRHYVGHDCSAAFMAANRTVARMLAEEAAADLFAAQREVPNITLHECDSRAMPTAAATGDFTITSPPYWNLEHYGDEPAQLGAGSYDAFLNGLAAVAAENYRTLKPGAFCVWCVNDFRTGGKFYSYHEDAAACLRHAGFYQHDIAVVDLGAPIRAAFASQVVQQRILAKRHEYALVFRKPDNDGAADDDDYELTGGIL